VQEPYDPELPFLEALEREVRREAERVSRGAHHHRPAPASAVHRHPAVGAVTERVERRRSGLPSSSLRIARRSLVLVGLLCLVGATAYGASRVFSSDTSNPLSPRLGKLLTVADGNAGERWSLRLYVRGGELCRALLASETLSSRCEPSPTARAIQFTSAVSPTHRYVFGVTGAAIAKVSLRIAGVEQTLQTHTLDYTSAHAAGLPSDVRFFLAVLQRPPGNAEPPASVSAVGLPHRRRGVATRHR
jgi:hypothetical protein